MPTLKQLREDNNCYGIMDARCWTADARADEREDVIAYLRSEATKGTSDLEHKMNKIIAAIERGDHE